MVLLDESVLKKLAHDLGNDTLKHLLGTFITETEACLNHIETLQSQKNWSELSREGHSLKSTAGSFGLVSLQDKAHLMEEACRKFDVGSACQGMDDLSDLGRESLQRLRRWMQMHCS